MNDSGPLPTLLRALTLALRSYYTARTAYWEARDRYSPLDAIKVLDGKLDVACLAVMTTRRDLEKHLLESEAA